MKETYGELSQAVWLAKYYLGVTETSQIAGAIRALKRRVRECEKKLAEYEPVLPTVDEDSEEEVDAASLLPDTEEAEG